MKQHTISIANIESITKFNITHSLGSVCTNAILYGVTQHVNRRAAVMMLSHMLFNKLLGYIIKLFLLWDYYFSFSNSLIWIISFSVSPFSPLFLGDPGLSSSVKNTLIRPFFLSFFRSESFDLPEFGVISTLFTTGDYLNVLLLWGL